MDFYLNLVACTRIQIKGEKSLKIKGTNPFQIWIFDNLLPKLSRVLKIEGLHVEFRRRNPDGRTRGSHVRKSVANYRENAAITAFSRLFG